MEYYDMMKPFKSDGCSMWPDGHVYSCCYEHDLDYWMGGDRHDRAASDERLRRCVTLTLMDTYFPKYEFKKSWPFIQRSVLGWRCPWGLAYLLGRIMWVGVRLGGGPFWPTPFRWGFGHTWPKYKMKKKEMNDDARNDRPGDA